MAQPGGSKRYGGDSTEQDGSSLLSLKATVNRQAANRVGPNNSAGATQQEAGGQGPRANTANAERAASGSMQEKLYEAWSDVHAVCAKLDKQFDAPAILVVGHQTDGKSALVEALVGFQFNAVGGGTKTRRPIALHMTYSAVCSQPVCTVVTDDMSEMEMSLGELQEHIEAENARLEQDQEFSSKEIVVRIQYKYCPNLTLIDTPGLISAAPGKKNSGLQGASRAIEAMVRQKMEQPELIILCLEDQCDWTNATTRRLVMQVDPNLSRTVLVSTKFDSRLPTFSRAADVETFIKPGPQVVEGSMLGGAPFFTSVPAGRVGTTSDCVYTTNEAFRAAVADREATDVAEVEAKLQRRLDQNERSHIGVGRLRVFLESLLQQRYLQSVPSIIPLLDREMRAAHARLTSARDELSNINPAQLKEWGRAFTDQFLRMLGAVLRGTASAPPDKFGETTGDEHARGDAFISLDGKPLVLPEGTLANSSMHLYGGAQLHRAMTEFRLVVGQIACPDISREDIANACGLDDVHDGANYVRAACTIAVAKAREAFEPFIHQLGGRLSHVMRRLLPVTVFLLERDANITMSSTANMGKGKQDALLKHISSTFNAFIDEDVDALLNQEAENQGLSPFLAGKLAAFEAMDD